MPSHGTEAVDPSADILSELAEARRRLAELEAIDSERARAGKVQEALYPPAKPDQKA